MNFAASLAIPLCICLAGLAFFYRDSLFDDFLEGAKKGLEVTVGLLPTLVALMVAIAMFSASGALDFLVRLITPAASAMGVPPEILPVVIMRPVSGSGSLALAADLFARHGPDSYAGLAASVLMGSSDTVFYIFAVYFSAGGVKRTRYALPAAMIVQLLCVILSCRLARLI